MQNIGIMIHQDGDAHTSNNVFYNNLIYNENATNTINFAGVITDVAGFNNLNGTADYQIDSNIAADPLWADVNASDFHLTSNSPCIDAGTNTLATYDFDWQHHSFRRCT